MNTTFQQTVNCQNTTCLNQGVHPIASSRSLAAELSLIPFIPNPIEIRRSLPINSKFGAYSNTEASRAESQRGGRSRRV